MWTRAEADGIAVQERTDLHTGFRRHYLSDRAEKLAGLLNSPFEANNPFQTRLNPLLPYDRNKVTSFSITVSNARY